MNKFVELGATGLRQYGGYVREEFLPELQGDRAAKVFTEMSKNDAIVGATLYAIKMLIRRIPWTTEPGDGTPGETITAEDRAAAIFIETCRLDMSRDWPSLISEILSCLVYGWSLHEIVYKLRQGDGADPAKRSRYSDGKIGWRKLPIRAQTTLQRWDFDEEGGVQSMVQVPPPDFRPRTIPIDKSLLFRTSSDRGNPEGESILRTAYRAWFYKKRIEEIEAMGVERDLGGFPVVYLPQAWMDLATKDSEEGRAMAAAVHAYQEMVTKLKRDQHEGAVLPAVFDEHGNRLLELTLLTSGGKRQFDTDAIIGRYSQQIAMCVLADFILLGHEKVGSNALGVTKAEIFSTAVEAIVGEIAGVFNRHAIPRLLALNGMKGRAHFKPGDVERIDLAQLGDFLQKTTGIILPDGALEDWLRELAKAPPREDPDAPRDPAPAPAKETTGDPEAAEKRRRPFGDAAPTLPRVSVAKAEEGEHVLLAIADRLAPEVARQFLEAVGRIRAAVDLEAVIAALEAGDLVAAEAALGLAALPAELEEALATLRTVVGEAGRAVAAELAEQLGRDVSFDLAAEQVAARVRTHGLALVQGVTESSRQAMRDRLAEVIAGGRSPREAVPTLLEHLGLTERDSAAAASFGLRLRDAGEMSSAQVERAVERYTAQKLRDRAQTIADHEALTAAGTGRQECWVQAEADGLLPETARRVIVVTDDDRLCEHCAPLDGKEFPLDGEVISGADETVRSAHMPLHVRCRCQEVLKLD